MGRAAQRERPTYPKILRYKNTENELKKGRMTRVPCVRRRGA